MLLASPIARTTTRKIREENGREKKREEKRREELN
jgi:hypothetical protein